ncbi:MAG TPA: hypothetical protein VLC98_18060, partial [Phnomibacter sp.]|nr:hypothetical protein [Phnomibacter sp.]
FVVFLNSLRLPVFISKNSAVASILSKISFQRKLSSPYLADDQVSKPDSPIASPLLFIYLRTY